MESSPDLLPAALPPPVSSLKSLSDWLTGLLVFIVTALIGAAIVFLAVGVAARAWHWMLAGIGVN